MTRARVLKDGAARLRAAGVPDPGRDARALLCWAEGIETSALISDPDAPLKAPLRVEEAFGRRMEREPVSRIIGRKAFWSLEFITSPDVLDPRPESETLIEAALAHVDAGPGRSAPLRIADMGTGSGCLLLSLLHELPHATGVGADVSETALGIARANAKMLHLENRAVFLHSDWFESLDEQFDLVVCNPPYIAENEAHSLSPEVIRWDPRGALFAGMDGLQAYRRIASGLPEALGDAGCALLEVGTGQAPQVARIMRGAGLTVESLKRDLGGIERCVIARRR